jgi:glycosyltransferase involved in cell wall biosynthesis
MKKIILINSGKFIEQPFFDLFADVGAENHFFLWTRSGGDVRQLSNGERKNKFFGPEPDNFFSALIFILCLPAFWVGYFFPLLFFKRREHIAKIICTLNREKLIFTPLARLLKIKAFWLEMPGQLDYKLKRWRRFFSGPAELITFTAEDSEDLAKEGFQPKNIHNISLSANLRSLERQDNLFSSLAKADKPYSFYKNFTVGCLCERIDSHRLEILLQAVKACVNLVPNFRLVVIGPGADSANLHWLVKNLGLGQRVWLLGEQKNLLRWFDDLDLYLILAENLCLNDLEKALAAASCGVPLLGFPSRNLSAIIREGQNGLQAEAVSAEAMAQKLITLEADERGRKSLGANGQKIVREDFDRQKQIEKLKEIIDL